MEAFASLVTIVIVAVWQIILVNCTDLCKKGDSVQAALKTMVKNSTLVLNTLPTWPTRLYKPSDFHTAARNLVLKHVKTFTDVPLFNESDALKVMWGQGTEQDLQHVEYASAVWRSLSLLMLQPEYILSRALRNNDIFPKIYGTCGDYYIQESCPPRRETWIPPELLHLGEREAFWMGRARDALKTLHLPDLLHNGLPDSLLGCDFKNNNVGFCKDGSARIIDSNNFYFKSSFATLPPCQNDRQCRVVKCSAKCSNVTGRCHMNHDLNLEYVCRWLFMHSARKLSIDPPPAVAKDLSRVLDDCTHLCHLLDDEPEARARVLKELTSVLNRSLLLHPLY